MLLSTRLRRHKSQVVCSLVKKKVYKTQTVLGFVQNGSRKKGSKSLGTHKIPFKLGIQRLSKRELCTCTTKYSE